MSEITPNHPDVARSPSSTEGPPHDLLIGVLALQEGFIDAGVLVASIEDWGRDRSRRIGPGLVSLGLLDPPKLALLESRAARHRESQREDHPKGAEVAGSTEPASRAAEGSHDPIPRTGTESIPPTRQPDESGESRPSWATPTWGDRFEILQFHNAGSLGKVSIAIDRELRRRVAYKEIREDLSDEAISRNQFLLEALVTGGLEHPGIVPVYGLGSQPDGRPYYAMRFIRGPSLSEKLRRLHNFDESPKAGTEDEPSTLPQLLRHFVGACYAMAYAHSRGVLHRDLKPEHIMIGPYGETLVVDWGCAMSFRPEGAPDDQPETTLELPREVESGLSRDGSLVGTIHYMSPEQARCLHSQLDQRSDIYALGVTLYCLLTGRRSPYQGIDLATVFDRVKAGEFPRPRQVKPDVSPTLEAICLKAMSLDPEDRYPTAIAFARDVERWLDDEPTIAYREPLTVRAARWLRRHRTITVGTITLLTSTALGLGIISYETSRANVAIRLEKKAADVARDAEAKAREQAEEDFRLAIKILDDFHRVAAKDLPEFPGTEVFRREVAERSAQYAESLLARRMTDPRILALAGRAHRESANVLRLTGDPKADAIYERAIFLLREAVRLVGDPGVRDYLAETLIDQAEALQNRDKPGAVEPLYREALKIARELRASSPGELNFHRTEARVLYNWADYLLTVGEFEEAHGSVAEAAQLMTPLADGTNPGPTDRLEVALLLITHGVASRELGRGDEAEAVLDDSTRRAESLLDAMPENSDLRFLRANARLEFGRIRVGEPSRRAVADEALGEAIGALEDLTRREPNTPHYRSYLAEALISRAAWRHGSGEHQATRTDLEQARAILESLLEKSPGHPRYHGLMGVVLGGLGRLAFDTGARGEARDLLLRAEERQRLALKSNPRSPDDLEALSEHREALRKLGAPTTPDGPPRPAPSSVTPG